MMSLEILNSVPPYPLQYNKAATRKLAKYCPNPLSVTSVCFGFVKTTHIKGNVRDKTVQKSFQTLKLRKITEL